MSQNPINSSEIQRFEDQYRQNPDSLVFARLADAYRKAGDPKRALEILESGIGRHRNYPSAHIIRAKTCIDLGQSGSAEEAYLRVLELDSGNLVALRGLAALARERGDLAGARQWFQRISGLDQGSQDAVDEDFTDAPDPAATSGNRHLPSGVDPLPRTEEEWWTPDSESDSPSVEPEDAEPAADGQAEAWWFEDPDEGEPASDGDLLTRTMAQLYEKQGLVEEAAAIYRELLSDRPEDKEMQTTLARLETRLAAIAPVAPLPDELLPEIAIQDEPGAEHPEPANDDSHVPESSADVEREAHASGRGEVFLAWLRRIGE
ncbi:MAG: tetratricopeptide repeat protein [Gemmatimonadota bacterium]